MSERPTGAQHAPFHVYQQRASLPVFDGKHALVGSWIVGDEPAGIGRCTRIR
jgi:glutathionylspermidine synthase